MGIKVCVVGASGLVGLELLAQLCADADIESVQVLVRKALNPNIKTCPKLREHLVDFDQLDKFKWPRCDVLFCALGTTMKVAGSQAGFHKVDCDYVVASARHARQAGASALVVVSAMGAKTDSVIFYNRIKGEMEAAVMALGFDSVTIVRPALLMGERAENRFDESIGLAVMKLGNFLVPKRHKPIPVSAVARAMLAAAKERRIGIQIVESDKMQDYR